VTTVTGRTYTATRVRGFAPWSPTEKTLDLLALVNGVLDEYQAQLPLTARQIFYRLVGAHGYDKTEQAYNRPCELLNRARRARLIDFNAIRDDGTMSRPSGGWLNTAQFWRAVRGTAQRYTHDPSDGQPVHVELWIEATGMVPQAVRVAHPYGVSVYSAGGFNGLTDKFETAQRLADQDRPCVVLHAGDYDPSGCAIIDSLAEDVAAFHSDLAQAKWTRAALRGQRPPLEFKRIAVTPAQIARYRLPTAPQKRTDQRGERMDDTVQAEALPPDILARELREAIEQVVDLDVIEANRRLGTTERGRILRVLDGLDEDS